MASILKFNCLGHGLHRDLKDLKMSAKNLYSLEIYHKAHVRTNKKLATDTLSFRIWRKSEIPLYGKFRPYVLSCRQP